MKIFYLPLEPYRERYTELLANWTVKRWENAPGVELIVVPGTPLGTPEIKTGAVLDAHGRAYWSATQVANLVRALTEHKTHNEDVIFFDDMFTPGYEALPYILDQLPALSRPRVFVRNYAQSVDPDDFTFNMRRWMRHYESLVCNTSAGVIVASSIHAEMMRIAMLEEAPIHVLGLPYDEDDVRSRLDGDVTPFKDRPKRVIYSSRWDAEKQPHFFMDVLEDTHRWTLGRGIEFVVCTGSNDIRSNDPTVRQRVQRLEAAGKLTVMRGCTKAVYYRELANCRAQINTARQDFISFTAIEASTFGTPTLAPAFRSFPETLRNDHNQLYVPWSVEDAASKLIRLVNEGPALHPNWLSKTQHRTLDRTLKVFEDGHYTGRWWEEL